MMPNPGNPENSLTPNEGGDTGLPSTFAALVAAVSSLATTNAALSAQLASLQVAGAPETTPQKSLDITAFGNGSGAGSPEVYREMLKTNWHGRLGRTHMVEVDKMSDAAKQELDCFIRRSLHKIFPVGKAHTEPDPDSIFAALSAFGLRLEDRGVLADVVIINDSAKIKDSTTSRLQNFIAYYCGSGLFTNYWKGSAEETLFELARYRGLFREDGFLRSTN